MNNAVTAQLERLLAHLEAEQLDEDDDEGRIERAWDLSAVTRTLDCYRETVQNVTAEAMVKSRPRAPYERHKRGGVEVRMVMPVLETFFRNHPDGFRGSRREFATVLGFSNSGVLEKRIVWRNGRWWLR